MPAQAVAAGFGLALVPVDLNRKAAVSRLWGRMAAILLDPAIASYRRTSVAVADGAKTAVAVAAGASAPLDQLSVVPPGRGSSEQ